MKKHKIFLGLISICYLLASCGQAQVKNSPPKKHLKGTIKTSTTLHYSVKDGDSTQREFEYKDMAFYNEKGVLMKDSSHWALIKSSSMIKYKYDDKGKLLELISCHTQGYRNSHDTAKYYYDDKGNEIKRDYMSSDHISDGANKSKYDDKGNTVESEYCNSDGSLRGRATYLYDNNGKIIEEKYFDSNGSLKNKSTFKYDRNGKLVEENSYNSDGSLDQTKKYKYDDGGNEDYWTEMIISRPGRDDDKTAFGFEYDKYSNWVKRFQYEDGVLTQIDERVLSYY